MLKLNKNHIQIINLDGWKYLVSTTDDEELRYKNFEYGDFLIRVSNNGNWYTHIIRLSNNKPYGITNLTNVPLQNVIMDPDDMDINFLEEDLDDII